MRVLGGLCALGVAGAAIASPEPGTRGLVRQAEPSGREVAREVAPPADPRAIEFARRRYARRFAVAIGVDAYDGESWPRLDAAVADARRMAELFRAQGFDETLTLLDGEATRAGIQDLLERALPTKTGERDLVVVFFAGHGGTEADVGYVVPYGADGSLARSAISVQALKESALRMTARHVVFLVDACFSGTMFRRGPAATDVNLLSHWEAAREARLIQIMTAGRANETVTEIGGWGTFTRALHAGLEGRADRDGDGVVTMPELAASVIPAVEAGGAQHPEWGNLDGTGTVLFWDARRLPAELAPSPAARELVPGLEGPLREIHAAMDRQQWPLAEKRLRKLTLENDHPELYLLLAEIYLEADALGNSALIAAELERAQRGALSPRAERRLLDLKARLEKARRGPI